MPLRILLAIVATALFAACNSDGPADDNAVTPLPSAIHRETPTQNNRDETGIAPVLSPGELPPPMQVNEGGACRSLSWSDSDSNSDSVGPGPRGLWNYENYLRWTPDGSGILFDVSRGPFFGSAVLYSVTTDPSADSPRPSLEKIVDPSSQPRAPLRGRGGTMISFDVSPDGSHIVYSECIFIEHRGHWIYNYEIMLSRLDGTGDAVRLTENITIDNFPVWSPDGNRIAFVTSPLPRRVEPGAGRLVIYTLPEDSTSQGTFQDIELPIGDKVGKAAPRWSPDGQTIAFVTFEWIPRQDQVTWGRYYNASVYTIEADGTDLAKITENAASGPAWSPDGQRIAVVTHTDEDVENGLPSFDVNEDPSGLIGLRTFAADGSDPVVASTNWLVFWEVQQGGFREVQTSSGETEPYSYYLWAWRYPTYPWIGDLSWSPDGSEILLESNAVRVPLDGSPLSIPIPECILTEHLHEDVGTYWYPDDDDGLPMLAAWSPDGSRIAVRLSDILYSYRRVSRMEENPTSALLYTVNRDGTSPRLLAVQGKGEMVYSDAYGRMVESVTVSPPPGGDFSC